MKRRIKYEVVNVGASWAVQTISPRGHVPIVAAFRPTKEDAQQTCDALNDKHDQKWREWRGIAECGE